MKDEAALDPSAGRFRTIRLPSDEKLAKHAAEGDERAFAAIYQRYHQDLYRFCMAIVSDRQDAQDALQNAMVKALRALPGETRQIQLKPWLYRITHNEAIEILRRRRETTELDPELAVSSAEPSETAATRQRLRQLLDDLGELPLRQRSALVMRELSGLAFGQIAEAFDTSEAVVRQTVYEARLSLRQIEAGREMSCKKVMWDLSEADGRVARRRDIQAHLRTCPECRAFHDEIGKRRRGFAAIAPLPLAASTGLLKGVLGSTGIAAGVTGGGAALKAVATVAVVAAGIAAADRGGLIETPLPASIGGDKSAKSARETSDEATQTQPGREQANGSNLAPGLASNKQADDAGPNRALATPGEKTDDEPGGAGGESLPASENKGASGKAKGNANGRSKSKPAASDHGQSTAAKAHSTKKPKGSKGNSAHSNGANKPAAPPKGDPPHGPGVKSKGPSAPLPPNESGGGKVGADKSSDSPVSAIEFRGEQRRLLLPGRREPI